MKKLTAIACTLALLLSGCTPSQPKPIQPDENKMLNVSDHWMEQPNEPYENTLENYAKKLNSIKTDHLSPENKAYYCVIPDKTYYFKDNVSTFIDHDAMMEGLSPLLADFTQIDISDLLSGDDFYYTDAHWRQENILPVANRLGDKMGFSVKAEFENKNFENYVGMFGDRAKSPKADKLTWLVSDYTEKSLVSAFESDFSQVYDNKKLESKVPYDIFLSGPSPFMTITNPLNTSGKELVMFRDSFASSLTPLLLEGYSKITLVDLRYMSSKLISEYVEFNSADVLFLMSARVVNNSMLLK